MKKFFDLLFSTKATLILLLLFAIGSAAATFIEDSYDTEYAHKLIYNAHWFEILMLLMVLNFIGNIRTYNLLSRKRITGFVFHLAFVLIIFGAGVTRYFGFDGNMPIREGKTSSAMYSSEIYFQAAATYKGQEVKKDLPLIISSADKNSFEMTLNIAEGNDIVISSKKYIANAIDTIVENKQGGTDILYLNVVLNNGLVPLYIKSGEEKNIGTFKIAFNYIDPAAICIARNDSSLSIKSDMDLVQTNMMGQDAEAILRDSVAAFKENYIYKASGLIFAFGKLYKNASIEAVESAKEDEGEPALIVDIAHNDKHEEAAVYESQSYAPDFEDYMIDGIPLQLALGYKEIQLPFALHLNKFILDRYPGSMSPSSYASDVTLLDSANNVEEPHTISMNNVLDYKGYRFFQSSYDIDEKGTILSVNHDSWGTMITYIGYFLLGVGFLLTLLNKNSRFYVLRQSIKKIRDKRKASILSVIFLLGLSTLSYSQTGSDKIVSSEHADKFGHLIVQTYDGRFEPMHTLAYDVMHKLSRKDKFYVEDKGGSLDAMQVFIDMIIDPDFWKKQDIIYVREQSVRDVLGVKGSYACYNDFLNDDNTYKLASYSEKAFRKKPSEQNTFDKDILKVNERIYIFENLCYGSLLKIFPVKDSKENKWITFEDSLATAPLTGSAALINDDLQLQVFSYSNILQLYFQTLYKATQTGEYDRADKILSYIESLQRQNSAADILPSEKKIDYEIFYNKAKIFENLRNVYGVISLVLLFLAFIDNLRKKKNKIMRMVLNVFIVFLGIAFLYHTFGLGLRWYLSGHAPWSNGYEALLLVAWGGILAGFIFLRYSKITLAATAVLAFAMLMTAGHSSYDPQLTNLQPVLKSYWLILHVAAITISYGFLGLGFVLGLMNMFIFVFKNKKNGERLDMLVQELTLINEMNLEIGLFLATIGTFLGGVWANVSWGRYWGWDAKETWALIIVIVYAMILHFRLVPKMKSAFIFNVSSIIGFASVLMTFIGVNYYLSKGLHSYATGDTPVFPIWAWMMILAMILLMVVAGIRNKLSKKKT